MKSSEGYHEVEGGRIHYRWKDGGPVIIYIHGHGDNIDGLVKQRDYFEKIGFGSLSYDQRGCGDSLKPLSRKAYSLEKYITDLDQLVELVQIDNATLISQSSGTAVAQYYSLLHPDKVDGLILISPIFNPKKNLKESIYGRALLVGKPVIEMITRVLERTVPTISMGPSDAVRPGSVSGTGIITGTKFYLSGTKRYRKALRLRLNSIIDWNLEGRVRDINKPTLLIHGSADRLIDPEVARQMHELIESSELNILDGDHEVQEVNYPRINETILDFLRRRIYQDL